MATPVHRRTPLGLWPLWSLVPFGWGTWIGFTIAATRTGWQPYRLAAVGWAVLALVAIPVSAIHTTPGDDSVLGFYIIATWAGGAVHAWSSRPAYLRRLGGIAAQITAARDRVRTRHEALQLAESEPEVAREMRVGRPDLPGAPDLGLVDVNSAPATAIATLPGIDAATADRIVSIREQVNGFTSLEDLGMTLDLDGDAVELLRGHVVFLPR